MSSTDAPPSPTPVANATVETITPVAAPVKADPAPAAKKTYKILGFTLTPTQLLLLLVVLGVVGYYAYNKWKGRSATDVFAEPLA